MQTWRVLQEKEITLTRHYYLLIVRALFNGGHIEEAIRLVKFLGENHHVSFILPVYNFLLSACAKMKDVMYRDQCLNLMDKHLLGKNEHTYTALLKLAVWEKNLLAVHEILREQCKYYNLNIISLRKFIRSFTELNDLESAYKTLQYMVSVALKEGTYLRRTMLGKIICPNLDIPIPSATVTSILGSDSLQDGDFRTNISDDCEEMITNTNKDLQCIPLNLDASTLNNPEKGPIKKVLRWSFNDVIRACGRGNAELVGKLIMQMQNLGLEPSPWTYDCFVRAVIPGRNFRDTVELLKIMEEKEVKLYDSTLLILSISFSKALNLDSAESLLNQITRSSHPHPYNAFLAACDKMEQPERAIPMLAKMRDLKIKPNIRTYALLFSLFGNVNAPYEKGNLFSQAIVTQRINAIQADMLENGVQHNKSSMFYLLNALGSEGMVQEMMRHLYWAEEHLSALNCLNVGVYNIVLHWLNESNETYKAFEIFKNMKLCGLRPDASTYNIMVDCCGNIRCLKSARALVSLMVRDGFPPQTPTYTAFIKVLLRCNALDEALNLLDQALSEAKPDVLLFNTILLKASAQKRIDVIEHVLKVMQREKIRPDPSTCSYVFNAYVERGFFGTAVEALQVLSIQMISKDNYVSTKRIKIYEDLILSEEPDAEMKIIQKFNHSNIELVAALLNLRWCSFVGASISWVPDQSPWAERLRDTDDR
ncbi:pentatricopeptide repeat-containing protein At1g76280-like [Silene latifolia]|uniref:pentatricopeptide repeat-containing protein At1g76280-like n=1 Tax=Silene latifolia TaxID=37657 RepID=UPI003D77A28F